MNKLFKFAFFAVIAFNLILSSWFVLHGDVEFNWEVARDLFLLEELDEKKIVLIGPGSTTGLFHGPLWTYINYPAFILGNGNPVIVGWGWIVMIGAFLISGYYIAKKLFDEKSAYLFVLMISVYSVFHAKSFYNPHGAMLIIPAFFFFFMRYIQTKELKYLIAHVLLAGFLIQFQMAIGIPFFILSFLYAIFITIKSKEKKHLFAYLLVLATLANFLIFDLRHEFLLSKLTLHFLTVPGSEYPNIISMFYQRIKFMTTGIEFLRADPGYRDSVIFLIASVFLFFQIRDNKYKKIYYGFLYFYFGYLILSMVNGGGLLYFYLFPLFPFVFLIFSSFITSRYSKLFIVLFFIILLLNEQNAVRDVTTAHNNFIGRDQNSWLFLKNAASKMFEGEENEFGYFVYHPGILAYQPKYATHYLNRLSDKKVYYFQKKPTTYLLIAPPPGDNPYMKDNWWTINLLHINKKPNEITTFSNGYKIEKYTLTEEDMRISVEPNIDPGIHFR